MTRPTRRPPTEAKLIALLARLAASDDVASPSDARWADHQAARDAIRKLYKSGLPTGIAPEVVTATVAAVLPGAYDLHYMTRKAGTEHDAAIVQGVQAYTERAGFAYALQPALVATLAEHGGLSIAAANRALLDAETAVQRNVHTNLPSRTDRASLRAVSDAMAPWFKPGVVQATLALARQALPPTRWTGSDSQGATPPQTEEEWALFIACAFHPSPEAQALMAERAELFGLLDAASLAAVTAVLQAAHAAVR